MIISLFGVYEWLSRMRPLLVFLLGLLSYIIDPLDARKRLGVTLN